MAHDVAPARHVNLDAPAVDPALTHRLAELTRTELAHRVAAGAIGVVPVGALEQHGAHLPVGTDAFLVESICLAAAARARADVLVTPPVWTGFSPHHLRFGATVSLRSETFLNLLRDIVRTTASWLPRLILVNGHGGNRGPLTILALEDGATFVNYWELVPATVLLELFPTDRGSIGHAGQAETSLALAVAPSLVCKPDIGFSPIAAEGEAYLVPDMGPTGVLGDPSAGEALLGERFLEAVSVSLAVFLDQLPTR